jgi:Rps23 Pro-64 3,4-dihydroxylase Tpa1-like proline 4-hydroxylase
MDKNIEVKSPTRKANKVRSLRISPDTHKKCERIVAMANKKANGRKIRIEQVLNLALDLVNDEQIKELQERSLTNEDRKEILRQKYVAIRGMISKDDFTGFMMKPEFLDFLRDGFAS